MAAARTVDAERALAAWREYDAAQAIHALDREAVRSTDAPRALVLELLARPSTGAGAPRDLYNACARLGRLLADAGASPSLAVATIDGAARALAELDIEVDPARLAPARASVAEGYFAVTVEAERLTARKAWEYPACSVRIAKDVVAVVAGFPSDDGEALADWAARVALSMSKDGCKRAILSGADAPRTELAQALGLVGVEIVTSVEAKGWLSFLRK